MNETFSWWSFCTYLISLFLQAERTFRPAQETVPLTVAFTTSVLQSSNLDLSLRLTKLDQQGCPSSSFIAQLAPCLLPPPHCSWGSRSLATASLVPQALCLQRVPASPSGALPFLRAQPLPTIPPQVLFMIILKSLF